jgi:hypothetical protein
LLIINQSTAFGIFCGIITLLIVTYSIVSERAVKAAYNMWVILALDAVMVIFWLSAMGSLAALRASFNIPVVITKRYIVAGNVYLAILAVSAAVSAIEFVLFVASLVLFSIRSHRHRQLNSSATTGDTEKTEPVQQNTTTTQQQQEQQLPQQQYQQPQYQQPQAYHQAGQQQYQQSAQNGFTPVSPPQQPYQTAVSPPPQQYPTPTQSPAPQQHYAQHTPPYPVTAPLQGYVEAPAGR